MAKPRHIALTLLATLALGACAKSPDNAGSDASSGGFEAGFIKGFTRECVKSATPSGAPAKLIEQACDCSAKRAVKELSMAELATLPKAKIQKIVQECAVEAKRANSATP